MFQFKKNEPQVRSPISSISESTEPDSPVSATSPTESFHTQNSRSSVVGAAAAPSLEVAANADGVALNRQMDTKSVKKLDAAGKKILMEWYKQHRDSPYPNFEIRELLANQCIVFVLCL